MPWIRAIVFGVVIALASMLPTSDSSAQSSNTILFSWGPPECIFQGDVFANQWGGGSGSSGSSDGDCIYVAAQLVYVTNQVQTTPWEIQAKVNGAASWAAFISLPWNEGNVVSTTACAWTVVANWGCGTVAANPPI